jgi:crossover junction endodeoxyribonuclease RuvC
VNILGIDPGSRNCGFAIIKVEKNSFSLIDAGVIKVKSTEFNAQLLEICDGLDVIINQNSIDEVAIEDIFFAYNPKTVIKLAQFRGAIALKVLQKFDTFEQYTPLQVKQSLTGNGKADKKQVAFMVKRVLGIKQEIKPLDITDAMAIAITHGQRVKHNRSV